MILSDLEIRSRELEKRTKEFEERLAIEKEELIMGKIELLQDLLSASKPDPNVEFGSETKYIPILSEINAERVENEIMKLIKKIC